MPQLFGLWVVSLCITRDRTLLIAAYIINSSMLYWSTYKGSYIRIYTNVCMYVVCMYARMYACMYVCMYVYV